MTKAEEFLSRIAVASEAQAELSRQMFVCLSDLVVVLKPRGEKTEEAPVRVKCATQGCGIYAHPGSQYCPTHPEVSE